MSVDMVPDSYWRWLFDTPAWSATVLDTGINPDDSLEMLAAYGNLKFLPVNVNGSSG